MSIFKKFKNNIGLEENQEETIEKELHGKGDKEGEYEDEKHQSAPQSRSKAIVKEEKKKRGEESWWESKGQLTADIFETEHEFIIQAPVAGVNQDEIEIFVENDMLVIKGERKDPLGELNHKKYYHQECYWGPFGREVILPDDVNNQKISASFKKGILIIRIPKKKTEKRKIVVEVE